MVLYTLAEFKEAEGIVGTRHDTYLTNLAVRVSAMVDRYCRRTIESASFTEEIDGSGTDEITVSNPPVTAVSALKITTVRDFAATAAVDADDFVFDDAGLITLLPNAILSTITSFGVPLFWKGRRNIQVAYTGGFVTVPEDLKVAAMMWGAYLLNRRRMAGVLSSTIGSQTITFQSRQVPDEVRVILNMYKVAPSFVGRSVS